MMTNKQNNNQFVHLHNESDSLDEKTLVRLAQAGDDEAYASLYNSNQHHVVSIAGDYQDKGLPTEAVILAGNEGLRHAIMKYDPDQEFRFMSYAVWWIRNSIMMALCKSKEEREGHH